MGKTQLLYIGKTLYSHTYLIQVGSFWIQRRQ